MTRNQLSKVAFRSKAAEQSRAAALNGVLTAARQEAKAGHLAGATDLLRQEIDRNPSQTEAWQALARTLKQQGDLDGAAEAYRQTLSLNRRSAVDHIALADILRRQGRLDQALATCETGLALNSSIGEGHIIRAVIRKALGQRSGAVADLRLVVSRRPGAAAVHVLLSDMLFEFGRLDEAADSMAQAIRIEPKDPSFHERLARIRTKQGQSAAAATAMETMLGLRTGDAETYRSLAKLYEDQGRKVDAFDAYQKAVAIDPKFCKAYIGLGSMLITDYRFDLAESVFRLLVALAPDDPLSYHNLGVVLRLQHKFEEASVNYRRALERAPDFIEPLVDLCHIRQHFCDWHGLETQQASMLAASVRNGKGISPFAMITTTVSPHDHLRNARLEAHAVKTIANRTLARYAPRPEAQRQGRLKIGYVSTDFHTHATAMLIVDLFERHDKTRFEVFGYSLGPDDASALRRRLIDTFDTFVDLRGISNAEAARRIHGDGIDILIDLKGYTQDARVEIFASRAAPIQVNYLGYPGSMGADFMDYIIVDPVVAPESHAAFYDEKLVHLPHCYQPNDSGRAIAPHIFTRAEAQLPHDAFVFCCFNNSYKITEAVFDLWMRLLRQLPHAVLWLLEPNDMVAINLRREAMSRDVAEHRLIFAPRITADQHLARMRLADLFLDTLPVNAHTTASEALWMGLPVLTCIGDAFIGRVAASLLATVGLPELITTSLAAYEAQAVALARDPAALDHVRKTLEHNRSTSPLFDTARYARNYEAALLHMADIRDQGRPPEAFAVVDRG